MPSENKSSLSITPLAYDGSLFAASAAQYATSFKFVVYSFSNAASPALIGACCTDLMLTEARREELLGMLTGSDGLRKVALLFFLKASPENL